MPIPVSKPQPLAKTLIADELYTVLKHRIVSGELSPGQPLTDEGLAEEFGASRTPVREALNLLALQGFVETVPQRGTTVTELSARVFDDAMRVLLGLTTFAVREAIPLLTETDRDRLREFREATLRGNAALREVAGDAAMVDRLFAVYFDRYANEVLIETQGGVFPHVRRSFLAFEHEIGVAGTAAAEVLRAAIDHSLNGEASEAVAAIEDYAARLESAISECFARRDEARDASEGVI
ncbi:GntR family transcriptional regulator [Leucobacter albus]|uniref:GntR family transcriptional regulator n=1 Tax=Leucobacter albus TaxID=272210 RepID=A0ABW3TMT2_9MICO